MKTRIAGIAIPDSTIAREATELVREFESQLLFDHSMRVFIFGSIQGDLRGLEYDPEMLFIGSIFHDLGLVEGHRSASDRFEVDGANAASAFLKSHGVPSESVRVVWDAIALHTTPGIPEHKEPEVALVSAGVKLDVIGVGYEDVDDRRRLEILDELPRTDFKEGIIRAFGEGIKHKPETAFGNIKSDVLERTLPGYVRPNFCEMILASPFSS